MLIGHNPTMACPGPAARRRYGGRRPRAQSLMSGFPTSALAVFAQEQPWAELTEGSARLIAFHVGRA